MKNPKKNGSSKGISTLKLALSWAVGKTCEEAVLAAVKEQFLITVQVPVHTWEVFTTRLQNPTGNVETADSTLCTGRNWLADNSEKNGYVQLCWSGKRSREEFVTEFSNMKCTYLTVRRKLIPGILTGFF